MRCRLPVLSASVVGLCLLALGCKKHEIQSYRVQKETSTVAAPAVPPTTPAASTPAGEMASMANTPVATAQGAGLVWTAPAHWTAKAASAMRRGTFTMKGTDGAEAELSITAFPGDVGGPLANVNRWRGQIQLPPITDAELQRDLVHLDFNGLHFDVIDIAGAPGANAQRIVGASVAHEGSTWFFKLMGPDRVVAAEKQAFLTFLQTIRAP